MKKYTAVLLLLLLAAAAFAADFVTEDGRIKLNSATNSMNKKTVNAKKDVSLFIKDEKTALEVRCGELKFVYEGKASGGLDSVRQAVIKGSVQMVYDAGGNRYDIRCDSAFYENSILTLAGNVKIDYSGGDMPATATGSRATMNLAQDPDEDALLFSIEGDGERARITVPAAAAK